MATGRINLEENVAKGAQRIADAFRQVSKAKRDYDNAKKDEQRIANALRSVKKSGLNTGKVKK